METKTKTNSGLRGVVAAIIVAQTHPGIEFIENYTPPAFADSQTTTYIGRTQEGSLGKFYFLYERTTGGVLPHTRVLWPCGLEVNPKDSNGFKTIKDLKTFYEVTNPKFEADYPASGRMIELIGKETLTNFINGSLLKVMRRRFVEEYGVTR